ncbi:MAG: hypothetical protein LRY32_01170 [Flavobacterium sp.]|nr:hypothetical protein [Flavobacterium sp.]
MRGSDGLEGVLSISFTPQHLHFLDNALGHGFMGYGFLYRDEGDFLGLFDPNFENGRYVNVIVAFCELDGLLTFTIFGQRNSIYSEP